MPIQPKEELVTLASTVTLELKMTVLMELTPLLDNLSALQFL
jgi:hypothetical protein